MDGDAADRLKTLEVKIDGNGGEGLMQRVSSNTKTIKHLDDRIDQLELRKVNIIQCERQHMKYEENWKSLENRISKQIIDTINGQEKKWVRHVGPVLTGLAALLLALKGVL